MPTDLTIYLDDQPGRVAAVGRTLGDADVNIEGGFALVVGGQGIMHVLVGDDDADDAVRALRAADFEVRDTIEVFALDIEDRPGALGGLAQRAADAGVNLTLFYLGTATRIVVGAEDVEALRAALR